MTEKAAAPKDKDTGNQRYQRMPWQRRHQNQGRFETKKKDPEEIPVHSMYGYDDCRKLP